jgi:hypothetical protein
MSTAHIQTAPQTSKAKLAIFWLYVTLPLAWGVINTISQAMKLFKEMLVLHPARSDDGVLAARRRVRYAPPPMPSCPPWLHPRYALFAPLTRIALPPFATTDTPRRRRPSSWPS